MAADEHMSSIKSPEPACSRVHAEDRTFQKCLNHRGHNFQPCLKKSTDREYLTMSKLAQDLQSMYRFKCIEMFFLNSSNECLHIMLFILKAVPHDYSFLSYCQLG